ncbi:sugar porter family MFS transporter [Chitinophaga japonensis]|uniref:SP family sugar porter-like MFS transporter n=1 Tax=Chitinophaga japonensis TaxID=104662 RepID=A0A562SMZ9_CHIJA|nr:sugar porter family MFS transporter [Chitinophaga japonensis]TWI82667.1 SP family sugar porter-like MFS transporter [Chitinophaga japonensis]
MKNERYNHTYLFAISMISAMGGFLFGYDWVVIGGAKPFYERYFGITDAPAAQGWAMSCALAGCLAGAAISGMLSDRYGRKKLLMLSALLFLVSAAGTGAAHSFNGFIVYRIIGGVGIGLASNLSPMYIAEVTPAHLRGKYVSINQLTLVIGILAAQLFNWWIAEPVPAGAADDFILRSWNGQTGWRVMFWAELAPSVLFLLLLCWLPESPRWLATRQHMDRAWQVLARIGGEAHARRELPAIAQTADTDGGVHWRQLVQPGVSRILVLGVIIAAFQQWCGINVIFNYAEEVFAAAGYGVSDILFNIVITGSVNLVFTLVAMYTVDRWGRRALMLVGAGGLALIYAVMGALYYMHFSGWPLLLLVVLAIACYAMSLAPVTWVVLSEIFPNRLRGGMMAIATLSLWAASFGLTYTFPLLNSALGASGTFWGYGLVCIAGLIFIRRYLPETKGKTLEEIEQEIVPAGKENVKFQM